MPTVAKKPATKKAATPARRVFRRSAAALPLPPATAPTGPIDAAEVAAMGKGVDFASIKRASAPIAPPPAKARAGDLLKIKDFGKGVDWSVVASAVADRAR